MRSALRNPGVNPLLSKGWIVTTPQVNAGEADGGEVPSALFPTTFLRGKPSYYSPLCPAGEQGSKATNHTQKRWQRGFKSLENQ